MHVADKPKNINWGEWVTISIPRTGRKVTCKILGEDRLLGFAQLNNIYINAHLRNILGVDVGRMYDYAIERAFSWLFFWYIIRYHPDDGKRAVVLGATVGIVIAIIGLVARLALA